MVRMQRLRHIKAPSSTHASRTEHMPRSSAGEVQAELSQADRHQQNQTVTPRERAGRSTSQTGTQANCSSGKLLLKLGYDHPRRDERHRDAHRGDHTGEEEIIHTAVRGDEDQRREQTGTGAGNVLNEPENAGDETTRQGADSSAKKQTGTLDERAVESRLGNAAQRGDAKGWSPCPYEQNLP